MKPPLKVSLILAIFVALISLSLPACHRSEAEQTEPEQHKIVVTTPKIEDVTITRRFVCQIHSQVHIKVRALQSGYLMAITVKEGQAVKKGDVLFKVIPILYKAKWDAEVAEVRLADQEYKNTERLFKKNIIAENELLLYKAKLERAKAKANLAEAEYNFTKVVAPFDGIIDRLHEQTGSLIKEGDVLTSLSDNSLMWVYYNVPEAGYLEYQLMPPEEKKEQRIELMMANGVIFPQAATGLRIEAQFNNENGNIPFRADFPNPSGLLRHGMTGTVLVHRKLKNAVVIPQRATFAILDRQYVYAMGNDDIVHPREIKMQHELDDIFVIKSGLAANDKFVYEGVRQVHDGQKLEGFELRPPEQILGHQRLHAE